MSVIIINEVSSATVLNLNLQARTRNRASLAFRFLDRFELTLEARTRNRASLNLRITPPFDGNLNLQARTVNRAALNLRELRQENPPFVVTFRIAPRTRGDGRHKQRWKFSINNEEVAISDYTVEFPEQSAGCVVQVTLAQVLDRSRVTENSVYKFELEKKIGGIWRMRTVLDSGELKSSSLSIGFADRKKTDTFAFSTFEPVANKLGKAPLRDLVVLDPLRVADQDVSAEIEYDTEGRSFTLEKQPIRNLSLYKLLDEIILNRCGFEAWKTNIPNSTIKKANFSLGTTYMKGIAPHVGVFEPDFTMLGATLWLSDTTALLPAGFPAPAQLTIDHFEEAEVSREIDRLDAFRVFYNEDRDDWDSFVDVVEILPVSITGSLFDENYSRVELKRTTRKYYRNSTPDFPVKEDLIKEVRTTYGTFLTKGVVTEEFRYDQFGRQIESNKKTETQIPEDGGESNFLELAEEEKTTIIYAAHPFEPSKQVIYKVVSEKHGVISVDSENPYRGKDFKQPIIVADKSGNVRDSSTTEYGPTEKTTKTLEVLANSQVRMNIVKEDLINDRVDFDFGEVVYGEIGATTNGRVRKITVFATPDGEFNGYGREDLAIGELPLSVGIPLARRKLKRRRLGSFDLDVKCSGLELYMDRGISYTLIDREAGEIGVFRVRSFRFTGTNLKTRSERHQTTFRGRKI